MICRPGGFDQPRLHEAVPSHFPMLWLVTRAGRSHLIATHAAGPENASRKKTPEKIPNRERNPPPLRKANTEAGPNASIGAMTIEAISIRKIVDILDVRNAC